MPLKWIGRLSLGQKLALSFGLILVLLFGSLSALLFYLSRVNSYVDRHQRITIPGVVTASEISSNIAQMHGVFHRILEHSNPSERAATIQRLGDLEQQTASALDTYRQSHATRTHPILFGMLIAHGRVDLADQEDEAMGLVAEGLGTLTELRKQIQAVLLQSRNAVGALDSSYEHTAAVIESAIAALIEVHRKIDVEMKIEGDRLVAQARFVALGLVCLLGTLIVTVFALMRHQVASPLRRLATTADRVAHHDLNARFEPWPSRDEVGALAGSLTTMLSSLRDHSTALLRKTKELEAFTYSIAHDLKGPLREIEGFSSLLEKQFAETGDAQANHHIGVIRSSALRLTHMIEALLKYSRVEQQELPKQHFNVLEMLRSLVNDRMASAQPPTLGIQIHLPFTDLHGEPVSVRQALANVLDNAVKFSRQQPNPDVRIGGIETATERILSIRDNGIGFEAGLAGKLFGLFERLHGPGEYEGTGVGLAIVKLVMEKHGGRAWAESSVGQGSTFFMAFPNSQEALSSQHSAKADGC